MTFNCLASSSAYEKDVCRYSVLHLIIFTSMKINTTHTQESGKLDLIYLIKKQNKTLIMDALYCNIKEIFRRL
jgi:hypothetical protein